MFAENYRLLVRQSCSGVQGRGSNLLRRLKDCHGDSMFGRGGGGHGKWMKVKLEADSSGTASLHTVDFLRSIVGYCKLVHHMTYN